MKRKIIGEKIDFSSAGQSIVDAVGLPLVEGETKEQLARISIISVYSALAGGAHKPAAAARSGHNESLRKYETIVKAAERLKVDLERWHNNSESLIDKKNVALARELHNNLAAIYWAASSAAKGPSSVGPLAYDVLTRCYMRFFGSEPRFTYSELDGHTGPFWNFVRALRELTGLTFTEEAIRKVHTRRNQEKKRSVTE